MFAKQEWKFSKESYQRPGRERKGKIHSAYWLRYPPLIMVLISLDLASRCENFENFEAFWKFLVKLQVFPMEWSHPGWDHIEGLLGILKTWHFWKGHAKRKITNTWEKPDFEFWASKSSKYTWKMTFCPLFELQKVTLGEMVFEGSNQHQIQKFHLGWKVDRPSFPMSHLEHDLDQWNPLKNSCDGARPELPGARPELPDLPELPFSVKKHCFDYGWPFLLVDDGWM